MDRLEHIRIEVDRLLEEIADASNRKFAYIHLYGVAQFAAMLALHCHIDEELCAISGMLHDIAVYAWNVPQKEHAQKSAELAKQILEKSNLFQEEEISLITHAIAKHSDKHRKEDGLYAEILKDADVLSHYLYNPKIPVSERDRVRLYYIMEKLSLKE